MNKKSIRLLLATAVLSVFCFAAGMFSRPLAVRAFYAAINLFEARDMIHAANTPIRHRLEAVSSIDAVFRVKEDSEFIFISPHEPHIEINGFAFLRDNNFAFNRMEPNGGYSEAIKRLARNTAGGKLRFRTDSKKLSIMITLNTVASLPWMTLYGAMGTDIYCDGGWRATISPSSAARRTAKGKIALSGNGMKDIEILLPQYAGVTRILIGLCKDAVISPPSEFAIKEPIAFYGSSITQGASASRAGLAFTYLTARRFNADFLNFGFSGSAKGEESTAQTISKVNISAFIMEYDHNADTADDLRKTHYNFYKIIRGAHPDIPIIFLSRISGGYSITEEETAERDAVIQETLDDATAEGDRNVYFIDGCGFGTKTERGDLLADDRHPNDAGMQKIARSIGDILGRYFRN
jgi:hypothetical protein